MILVTGANGFLGSYLVKYLLQQGFQVRGLRRENSDLSLLESWKDGVEWVIGDLLDVTALQEAMEGVDRVYHTAAFVSFLPKDRDQMIKVNVEGTANVVNAALDAGVRKLLYVSSIAAIGRSYYNTLIDENTEWEDSKYNSIYGLSKMLGEHEVWRGIAEGLSAVVINPAVIIGAGKWSDSSAKIFKRVHDGLSFYTKGSNGYVDVRDVARIMILLMEGNYNGDRYIVSNENLNYQALTSSIAVALGVKKPGIQAPEWMTSIGWVVEELKARITNTPPILTREVALFSQKPYFYDNSKVKRALEYSFTPISQSVNDTAAAYLNSVKKGEDFATLRV